VNNKLVRILALLFIAISVSAGGLPDSYYKIKSIKKQKEVFFDILTPLIKKQNMVILKDRGFVKRFFNHYQTMKNNNREISRLKLLQKQYKINNLYDKETYLHKINTVPTSIIIAQAALESGWGKSRFVKEGNNIFGHWTYGKKGLIPKRRSKGAKHKIRIFNSLASSLEAYMNNINSNVAYKKVRALRAKLLEKGKKVDGLGIYKGYINYSELKGEYLRRLKNMITLNNLLKYDK